MRFSRDDADVFVRSSGEPAVRCPPTCVSVFPKTRYQGSKRKIAGSIVERLSSIGFVTVLDAFGGTGAVAHAFKKAGKAVTYNDVLRFNHQIGVALIENDGVCLSDDEVAAIGTRTRGRTYGDFIERTFSGIYFTDEENRWLDTAVGNLRAIPCRYKRALAYCAVFQAAIAKRPYNLFHRKNLYMRTARVKRSFGNKVSWDRSFAEHVTNFAARANNAVIDTDVPCRALCSDVLDLEPSYDLVYIDPPYINQNGVGVDYRDFYHFLEGMVRYDEWPDLIDMRSKHRRLIRQSDPWSVPATCHQMFSRLFDRFADSTLVVSYRSDGIPAVRDISRMLRKVKRRVEVCDDGPSQYALSTRRSTRQVLLIGTD